MDFRDYLSTLRVQSVDEQTLVQREAEAERAAQLEEARRVLKQKRRRLTESGIALDDEMLERIAKGDVHQTIAMRAVRAWLFGPSPAAVLLGPPGTGKTVAAGWAIAQRGGQSVKARPLVRRFASSWSTEVDRWERLVKAPLVVLEELGTESGEHAQAALLELLDERQSVSRRTLIMGNLDVAGARARFDERALSRLRRAEWIELPASGDLRARRRVPT